MKNIEDLYNYAKDKNIKVKRKNFEKEFGENIDVKGLCLTNMKKCNIYLDTQFNNTTEEKCVLAEEIGHFETGITSSLLSKLDEENLLIRSINEFRAKKWAVSKLIPFELFKSFLDTNLSKFEVAEQLDVTEEIIDIACFVYEPLLY